MNVFLLDNSSHLDSRGEFQRIFDVGLHNFGLLQIKQVNISRNPLCRTLRGMHYQISGPPEHKLISVLEGSIRLVVSNAHLIHDETGVENMYFNLSEESKKTLYVPSGLATGWISLSDNVVIAYMMTSRYEECGYAGFCFNDPFAKISWPFEPSVISEKDSNWPSLK